MSIQALLFDFVGVLLHQKEQHALDEIVDAVDTLVGQVTNDNQFRRTVCSRYHLNETAFQDILARIVDKYEPFQPLWNILPELRSRYKLAIINNGTFLTFPLFDARFGIKEKFDLFLSSAVEGVRKPDARIYQRACESLVVSPETCLFMDDDAQNVEGARRLGMQAIHWEDPAEGFQLLLAILEKNG
jgi:HAD superfamily hydrolase (TIGR01509 family)